RARAAFNAAVQAGRRLIRRAREAAQGILRRAREAANRVIAAADRACGGVITRVRNAVAQVVDRVKNTITSLAAALRKKMAELATQLRDGIARFAEACRRGIQQIRTSVRAAVDRIKNAFTAAVQRARTWVKEQYAAAKQWVQQTWDSISTWVTTRFNEIRDAIRAAVNTIVTSVTTAVRKAYDACATALRDIGTWLSEKWDQFCEWAQEAFVKFWTGPWRDILIGVGVALLIAAVTVATGGAGLAVIVAVSAGATAAARAGGEIAARRAAVAIKNDPERAARFQAEMEAEGGEAQRWYDGVAEDEKWMTTLGHGAVEGARGAVEGAVNGLVGGAAGAVSTRIAGGIAKAGAREGARAMGRIGVQRAAEFGTRMTVDAGLSLGGDVAMGAVNVELDVAMGIRTREEAYEMHIQQHLNPSSMAARLAGSGLTGGLRMGSHRGADSAIQDRIVQRVMGDAGREATDKAANRVMRETVDMTIGAADGGMQGGLMSMANGGSFSEGFAQGFVGGAASHGGQLAGERAGRRAIRPAPDTAGMVRNRTGNGADIDPTLRQDLSSDPTRRDGATDIDAGIRRTESDVDAMNRSDVETADGRQRPLQDDETQFIRIPPEQIEASRLQSQIAGLHGVPAAIRVVPDSVTPRPAGTISATQARRWQKTVADLETTPTGRDTLRHIQEKGVKVRLEDHAGGFFVPGANEIILGMNIRGRSNRSGVLAHEGGHSRHRDLVPEMETSSREGYVRGMAQDEARAQILLFEHHLEQGRIPENQAGYDTYMDAYHTERQRLQADHPEMSDIEVHERARQRGEDELADFWGQNISPNAEAKNADGGSPSNYNDYYGSYWDAMDARRQKQSQALPSADGKMQAPEGDATSARRQLVESPSSDGKDTAPSLGPGASRRPELDLPDTAYKDRIRILAESDGKITSTEAYTKTDDTSWAKLSDPESWVPERRQLHDRLIDRAKQDSRAFAEAMSDHPDTIYAMRGNTAAGKTRAIRSNIPELADAIDTTGNSPHRAINPDNFKLDLIRHDQDTHGVSNSHQQVHVESSTLAWRLKGELMDTPGSLLVDKRLGNFEDVQGLMQNAQRTGRKFNVYDVDAPLEMSLIGVLMRKPGGADPIPPFSVVAEGGFVPARENRRRSMALFEGPEGASVGKYEVFGTTADGRKIRVAEVVNGERIIHDREAYSRMQENPQLEVDRLRGETIDDAVIARVVGPLPKDFGDAVRAALEPYKGRNWDAALTEHGRPRPSQDASSGESRRAVPEVEVQGPRTTEPQGSMAPPMPSSVNRNRQDPQRVINDLSSFRSRRMQVGADVVMLDRSAMQHMLERHHPDYWNGTTKTSQSFFDRRLSVEDVADISMEVLRQNRANLLSGSRYSGGISGQYRGTVDGREYVVGLRGGKIGQLFPVD
ncbi:MAG: zeta toxin family protein, partial [Myxococcota bacterium]|nr:zeta toxin family protein [Myxococcota bacterium]